MKEKNVILLIAGAVGVLYLMSRRANAATSEDYSTPLDSALAWAWVNSTPVPDATRNNPITQAAYDSGMPQATQIPGAGGGLLAGLINGATNGY